MKEESEGLRSTNRSAENADVLKKSASVKPMVATATSRQLLSKNCDPNGKYVHLWFITLG